MKVYTHVTVQKLNLTIVNLILKNKIEFIRQLLINKTKHSTNANYSSSSKAYGDC